MPNGTIPPAFLETTSVVEFTHNMHVQSRNALVYDVLTHNFATEVIIFSATRRKQAWLPQSTFV